MVKKDVTLEVVLLEWFKRFQEVISDGTPANLRPTTASYLATKRTLGRSKVNLLIIY